MPGPFIVCSRLEPASIRQRESKGLAWSEEDLRYNSLTASASAFSSSSVLNRWVLART